MLFNFHRAKKYFSYFQPLVFIACLNSANPAFALDLAASAEDLAKSNPGTRPER